MEVNANAPVRDQSPNDFENLKRNLQGPLLLPGTPGYEDARAVWNAMIDRRPGDHSAVGNRDAAAVLNIAAAWTDTKDDDANIAWARAAWRDMRRFSTGGTYLNFLTEEEVGDRLKAAFGTNYQRLVEIKTRWDPTNMFRINKNIPPSAGATAPARTP